MYGSCIMLIRERAIMAKEKLSESARVAQNRKVLDGYSIEKLRQFCFDTTGGATVGKKGINDLSIEELRDLALSLTVGM